MTDKGRALESTPNQNQVPKYLNLAAYSSEWQPDREIVLTYACPNTMRVGLGLTELVPKR